MANSTRNIIVGAAALYISNRDSATGGFVDSNGDWAPAPLPAATPATSIVPAMDASPDWRAVGFTDTGLTLSYEPTYADVVVDQLLDSAKVFKSAMRVTLATTLVEASLRNLLVIWGQSAGSLSSTATDDTLGISSGALADDSVERALVAVGPAPKSVAGVKRERVYYTRRVLSVDTTAHSVRRAEATLFPVTFRVLPMGPNAANGVAPGQEYGFIRDRNVA
jgi:hypothetical protein